MPTREQTSYSRARPSLLVDPSPQMDHSNNPPNGNTDLFIPVGHAQSCNTSGTSTRQTSVDDTASTRTTTSISSTAQTSNVGDVLKEAEPISHGRRYIIRARDGARTRTEASLEHKSAETLRRESIGSGNTVTAPKTTSSGKEVPTVSRRSSSQDVGKTQSCADGLASTSVRQTPQDTRPTGDSSRPETTTSSVISRPRYPPTSYRGPINNAEAASSGSARPVRSVPPPLKPEATTAPLFGKLETSKATDAPASPRRTGGFSRLVRRLSGRRGSAPSPPQTPTNLPPRTPTKQSAAVPQTPRTESSSSIPAAPPPYTSPDASPSPSQKLEKSKNLRSRRRTLTTSNHTSTTKPNSTSDLTRSHSHSGTITNVTLPSPTHAYTTPIFFTTCPHTSPPSHRPLNIQPTLKPYTPTLLTSPPFHLRARLAVSQPIAPLLVITGSCCTCDYAARRRMEGEVLAKYADIRNKLLSRIRMLRVRMNVLHRTPKSFSQSNANAKSNSNSDSNSNSTTNLDLDPTLDSACDSDDASDSDSDSDDEGGRKTRVEGDALEEEQNIKLEILSIEGEIDDLPERQDQDVSGVWAGWGQKWGVGTVGIYRTPLSGDGDGMGRDGGQGDEVWEGQGQGDEERVGVGDGKGTGGSSDGLLGVEGVLGSEGEVSTGERSTSSVNRSGKTGLNRWGGKFDNVVVDGRMKLDWIRPDLPREEKGKGRSTEVFD